MSWDDVAFVGFDTETSGSDPLTAEIVSACLGDRTWLLRPTRPIPAAASAIHGITTEAAERGGMDHAQGLTEIRSAIGAVWAAGDALCVYNASFDCTILDRECRRHGLGGFSVEGVVVDPMVLDKEFDKYRRGKRTLVVTAAHYGVELSDDDAHGAAADATATAQLAAILAPKLPSPQEANVLQAKYRAEQSRDFADWLERQGNHARAAAVRADLAWPIGR